MISLHCFFFSLSLVFFFFWPFCLFTGAFTLSSLHSWLAYLNIFTPFSILATSSRQYWLNKLAHFTLCVVFHGVVGIDANNWNTWQLAGVGRAPERCRSTAVTAPVERPSHDDDDFISSSFVVKVVECPWVSCYLHQQNDEITNSTMTETICCGSLIFRH